MARLRTFIAVDIDDAIRARAVALQRLLARAGCEVRWVEPENLHVTLLFLGEVDDRRLMEVCRSVCEACAPRPAFQMSVEHAGCFPNPRRPRTLWVGVGQGNKELQALHDGMEPPLLDLGCYRREERRYTPHVTLGRVKGDGPVDKLSAALARQAEWQGGETLAREVLIMSSELTSAGPVYTVIGRAKLGS